MFSCLLLWRTMAVLDRYRMILFHECRCRLSSTEGPLSNSDQRTKHLRRTSQKLVCHLIIRVDGRSLNCVSCLCTATHIVMIKVLFAFLCYHHRDRWLDICRSGTTTKVQPIIRRRSTCAHTSSRRDTNWTTTTARASTGTSGSTARRAAAIWKSFPVPVAIITLAEADVSGWRDGSCSTGNRGPCPITDTDPTIGRTPPISERAPPRPTRKSRRGCRFVFKWVCVFGNFPENFSIHDRRDLRCTFLHKYLLYRVYLSMWIYYYVY